MPQINRNLFIYHKYANKCYITSILVWEPVSREGWGRPAESGNWRKCHLQKKFGCVKICQNKYNKTKWINVYFRRFHNFFLNSSNCGNHAVKRYNNKNLIFHLIFAEFICLRKFVD